MYLERHMQMANKKQDKERISFLQNTDKILCTFFFTKGELCSSFVPAVALLFFSSSLDRKGCSQIMQQMQLTLIVLPFL